MRLGRLPHDPVRLAAAPAHSFGATPVPQTLDRSLTDWLPGLYGNNEYSDCTCVSYTNNARGVAYLAGYELAVDPDDPLANFAALSGVPVTEAASVDGAVMQDVLAYQEQHGFNVGPQLLVATSGTVAVNRMAMAQAMATLGGLWIGVTLHEREMDSWGSGTLWDTVAPAGAIAGGHAVNLWAYEGLADDSRVWLATWGAWQAATWRLLESITDEAHGLGWNQIRRVPT
jgi:hypothetical protein